MCCSLVAVLSVARYVNNFRPSPVPLWADAGPRIHSLLNFALSQTKASEVATQKLRWCLEDIKLDNVQ